MRENKRKQNKREDTPVAKRRPNKTASTIEPEKVVNETVEENDNGSNCTSVQSKKKAKRKAKPKDKNWKSRSGALIITAKGNFLTLIVKLNVKLGEVAEAVIRMRKTQKATFSYN